MAHSRGPVVGIVGAGQLARMLIEAATPLGIGVHLLAARPDDAAARIWPHVSIGAPQAADALNALAAGASVLTFDHELLDVAQLRRLEDVGVCLRPSAAAVAIAQDKLVQRKLFATRGLPVPPFAAVRDPADVLRFGAEHGWPLVVKAARGGYDGRGVWVVDGPPAAEALAAPALAAGTPLLVEGFVPIERELAVQVVRRPGGETALYPLVETVQVNGICHEVIAPAPTAAGLAAEARRIALAVAEAVDVTGMLAIELFHSGGRLIVNEIAARPHNSGHWSIEGAVTSQFENHLRAVLDWPLGSTAPTAPVAVMVNVIGRQGAADPRDRVAAALAVEGVHVHVYEKEPRPGRKLGHVTALGTDREETRARARHAAALLLSQAEDGSESAWQRDG